MLGFSHPRNINVVKKKNKEEEEEMPFVHSLNE